MAGVVDCCCRCRGFKHRAKGLVGGALEFLAQGIGDHVGSPQVVGVEIGDHGARFLGDAPAIGEDVGGADTSGLFVNVPDIQGGHTPRGFLHPGAFVVIDKVGENAAGGDNAGETVLRIELAPFVPGDDGVAVGVGEDFPPVGGDRGLDLSQIRQIGNGSGGARGGSGSGFLVSPIGGHFIKGIAPGSIGTAHADKFQVTGGLVGCHRRWRSSVTGGWRPRRGRPGRPRFQCRRWPGWWKIGELPL